jgi:hypothetical protein
MSNIIAGHLQQQQQVQEAIDQLVEAGFEKERISAFYVNPAGQHDLYPIGGDQDQSPGARESGEGLAAGMATGGVIGAVVGMAGVPLAGPLAPTVGALVGAHLGALTGSMTSMKERGESEESEPDQEGNANTMVQRNSGMMVAVSVANPAQENQVQRILEALDAQQIERAEGTISDSNWIDFNPLAPPVLVKPEART